MSVRPTPVRGGGAGPDLRHEDGAGRGQGRRVAGVDEVGRGPLAGPVVAAAVVLPTDLEPLQAVLAGVRDSKVLSKTTRDRLAAALWAAVRIDTDRGLQIGIGLAEVAEIDRLNILQASFLAMRRALDALPCPPDAVIVDGKLRPPLPWPTTPVIAGDAQSLSIGAASILAKVHRDGLMEELAKGFPVYGWARNAGYGTAEHRAALERFGVTPHHRTSFAPVRARLLRQD